jgi:phosphoglycolate phosphatase
MSSVPRCSSHTRSYKHPMPYKLVLFDLDGTLSDSFPWFLRIVNAAADKHGFRRIEPHEIEEVRGKGAREIVKFFQVPAWKLPISRATCAA